MAKKPEPKKSPTPTPKAKPAPAPKPAPKKTKATAARLEAAPAGPVLPGPRGGGKPCHGPDLKGSAGKCLLRSVAFGMCLGHWRQSKKGEELHPLRVSIGADSKISFRLPTSMREELLSSAASKGQDEGEWIRAAVEKKLSGERFMAQHSVRKSA